MRVALFSECYLPWTNGVVTSVVTLRETLRERGHTVYLFTPGKPQASDDSHVIRLPELPFPPHPYHYARPFPKLPIDFSSLGIEVIHSQHPFTVGRLGAKLAKQNGLPLVYTIHAQYGDLAKYARAPMVRKPGTRVFKQVLRRYCSMVDTVIAPSHYTADHLRGLGVQRPIEIIPSGTLPLKADSGARERIRRELGIKDETRVLLYVGRICPVKRLDVLLRAVSALKKKGISDFVLVLVGEGPAKEKLEHLTDQLHIRDKVHFVGVCPHNEIGNWYAAADIFTLSSPSETQGMVLVEAMMAGLPCVAIDIGGPREVVIQDQTGYRVPLDALQFSNAIEKLLTSPELLHTFSQNARVHSQEFSAEKMAQSVLRVYERAQAAEHIFSNLISLS